MANNDNKRFYWLKLKKDFFQQHQIKVLKSLPNGRLYALIYLELLAESTTHDGELRYSKMLPYDPVTLASVIDEDKDNVEKAIETLTNLELIEILDDGTIFMREIQKLIGSETGQTIRKREAKLLGGKIYPENTLENRDKRIEIRDKRLEDDDIQLIRAREAGLAVDEAMEALLPYEHTIEEVCDLAFRITDGKVRDPAAYVARWKHNEDM